MSIRLNAWNNLFSCKIHSKSIKTLNKDDIKECLEFIKYYDDLDYSGFNFHLVRWNLDKPKRKNHFKMIALLMAANGILLITKKG